MKSFKPRSRQRNIDGILLLDKPLGLSSNQALQQVRQLFRAAKAGHTGSLDPLATGLLPICFGETTKLCGILLEGDKHYLASVRLGWSTRTGDGEGEVLRRSDPARVTEAQLQAALARFLGPIRQVPPMYSALKRQGRPLYELARAGEEVERDPREVVIKSLSLRHFTGDSFELEVRCSKGTYIRTLAEDIADAVGQAAHLSALRRLGAEPFDRPDMVGLDELERDFAAGDSALDRHLLPSAAGVSRWPQWSVDDAQAAELRHGRKVAGPGNLTGKLAILDRTGRLLALGRAEPDGQIAPERWMVG